MRKSFFDTEIQLTLEIDSSQTSEEEILENLPSGVKAK